MAVNPYVWQQTFTLGAAGTAISGTALGFPQARAAVVEVRFVYGSGGTAAKVYLQNSLDGTNFYDVACAAFTTTAATKLGVLNATSGTAWVTPTDGSLTDDTLLASAALGSDWRVKTISTGTYAASTVTVSVSLKP